MRLGRKDRGRSCAFARACIDLFRKPSAGFAGYDIVDGTRLRMPEKNGVMSASKLIACGDVEAERMNCKRIEGVLKAVSFSGTIN